MNIEPRVNNVLLFLGLIGNLWIAMAMCHGNDKAEILDKIVDQSKRGVCYAHVWQRFRDLKLDASQQKLLTARITKNSGQSAYLPLLLLHINSKDAYADINAQSRAKILCGAIEHLRCHNDFEAFRLSRIEDVPEFYIAIHEIVTLSDESLPHLYRLLSDGEKVSCIGKKVSSAAKNDVWRRKDIAASLAHYILQVPYHYSSDPIQRDLETEQIKAKVKEVLERGSLPTDEP